MTCFPVWRKCFRLLFPPSATSCGWWLKEWDGGYILQKWASSVWRLGVFQSKADAPLLWREPVGGLGIWSGCLLGQVFHVLLGGDVQADPDTLERLFLWKSWRRCCCTRSLTLTRKAADDGAMHEVTIMEQNHSDRFFFCDRGALWGSMHGGWLPPSEVENESLTALHSDFSDFIFLFLNT